MKDDLLKRSEPAINEENPWCDDALGRSKVAESLTNLLRDQNSSLVISLHGHWGTGKTFLLKRWQQDLRTRRFQSIYFNAWEDDFCDDPLTAIIGQLAKSFSKGGFKDSVEMIKKTAKPLLVHSAIGVVKTYTGISLKDIFSPNALRKNAEQRKHKDELKKRLAELAANVKEETNHPLVFIVDELDRCRPTFAIELLERVKHVFDIPNMVFIFGINHDQLGKSIQSVYGRIDADVYLRRFFDFEFTLPAVDSERFCRFLVERFELEHFFESHSLDPKWFREFFPILCGCFGFSLRDIEHCIRSIAFFRRNINDDVPLRAVLISLLVTLRLKNGPLYRGFVRGDRNGCEVMDYVDELISNVDLNETQDHNLNELEVFCYLTDKRLGNGKMQRNISVSVAELNRLLEALNKGEERPTLENLSLRTGKSDANRIDKLLGLVRQYNDPGLSKRTLRDIAEYIELYRP